jgi:surface polysaccharide O-acyltransferase-like enzyme
MQMISILLAFILAYVSGILGSYWAYAQRTNLVLAEIPYFSHYFSFNIIVQSLALFALLVKGKVAEYVQKPSILRFSVQTVATQSFGIYLYHLLIMYALNFNVNTFPGGNLFIFLVVSMVSIFLITLFFVLALRRTSLLFLLGETK